MKRISLIIILLGLALSIACAQRKASPGLDIATTDQVLDKYVEALGGKAAIGKLTSRVIKGSIEVGEKTGSFEYYSKAPNKYLSVTNLTHPGEKATIQEGFDGIIGWGGDSRNPNGVRNWTDSEVTISKRTKDFYKDIKLRELYPSIILARKDKADDRDGYVLELTPPSGKIEKMFFDAQTGLLTYYQFEVQSSNGETTRFVYQYDNYKEVDGVKIPFTIKRTRPSAYTVKVDEVKHNLVIEDSRFSKPSSLASTGQ